MSGGKMEIKDVVERLRTVEIRPEFPPAGDSHSVTAAAIYGAEARRAYVGERVIDRQRKREIEGAEAKSYYKEHLRDVAKKVGLAIPYGGTG
jgi:hypothetical protein